MMTDHTLPSNDPLEPDKVGRMVMLTYGRMKDGTGSYWCYVAVIPSQYDRFNEILKAGKLNLERFAEDGFGEVIISGPGLYPPAEITRDVGKMFNAPVRDLFGDVDPKSLISKKIEELKRKSSSSESA